MLPEQGFTSDESITKENINFWLNELAKEYRKLNKGKMKAEIIIVGGASILINYGFRQMTYDIDAIVQASSEMKEAINRVGDKHGLPNDWLNTDFKKTSSYSDRLIEVSTFYKEFAHALTVRTVNAEDLIVMKLMSGRLYKNDLSDVAGILWECQKQGNPILIEDVYDSACKLYGGWEKIPAKSRMFFEAAYKKGDYESIYNSNKNNEVTAVNILTEYDKKYPNKLNESNIDTFLENVIRQQQTKGYER